jgi:protein dithiol oxidoreductase (disulfide-forming)
MKSRIALLLLAVLPLLAACDPQKAPADATTAGPASTTATASSASDSGTATQVAVVPPAWEGPVPTAGVDYVELPNGQPYAPINGQVEVAEVFGYICSHCANFEPLFVAWKSKLPADVKISLVPATLGGPWVTYAQAFYAAETLGVLEQSHEAVFSALHRQHSLSPTATPEQIGSFYAQFGVDPKTFTSTMQGFAVGASISRSRQFAVRSRIEGTPSLVIDGRYLVSVDQRGYGTMLRTAEYLVAQRRAALK